MGANMNLTVFAGILLAVTMVTARRASSGEKTKQAAGRADEPDEAMREAARPAKLVEKIMRAAAEAEEPDEAKRESAMKECSFTYCTVATDGPSSECCRGEKNGPLRGRQGRCMWLEDGGWSGFRCAL